MIQKACGKEKKKKMHSCVEQVQDQGKSEDSAYAICTDSLDKAWTAYDMNKGMMDSAENMGRGILDMATMNMTNTDYSKDETGKVTPDEKYKPPQPPVQPSNITPPTAQPATPTAQPQAPSATQVHAQRATNQKTQANPAVQQKQQENITAGMDMFKASMNKAWKEFKKNKS
jgi:hypothetical protein